MVKMALPPIPPKGGKLSEEGGLLGKVTGIGGDQGEAWVTTRSPHGQTRQPNSSEHVPSRSTSTGQSNSTVITQPLAFALTTWGKVSIAQSSFPCRRLWEPAWVRGGPRHEAHALHHVRPESLSKCLAQPRIIL